MRNSLLLGIVLGAAAPLLAFILSNYTGLAVQLFPSKPVAFYVLAAAINLVLVRVFYRKEVPHDQVAKGIIVTTFLGMLLFLYFFKINM